MITEPITRIHPAQLTQELFDAKNNALHLSGRNCRVTLYLGRHEQNLFKNAMLDWVVDVRCERNLDVAPWMFCGFEVVPVDLPSLYRIGTELELG